MLVFYSPRAPQRRSSVSQSRPSRENADTLVEHGTLSLQTDFDAPALTRTRDTRAAVECPNDGTVIEGETAVLGMNVENKC